MKSPASPELAPLPPLRVKELIFVNEYLKPEHHLNATAAYRRLRPHVKYESAMSESCRLLKKPQVQQEIARRMRQGGVSKEWGETRLREYEAMAYAAGDYVAGASICMDTMKLAGFLVDKRQDVPPAPAQLSDDEFDRALTERLNRLTQEAASDDAECSRPNARELDAPDAHSLPTT